MRERSVKMKRTKKLSDPLSFIAVLGHTTGQCTVGLQNWTERHVKRCFLDYIDDFPLSFVLVSPNFKMFFHMFLFQKKTSHTPPMKKKHHHPGRSRILPAGWAPSNPHPLTSTTAEALAYQLWDSICTS